MSDPDLDYLFGHGHVNNDGTPKDRKAWSRPRAVLWDVYRVSEKTRAGDAAHE